MKRQWHPDELAEHFTLDPKDHELLEARNSVNQLGFIVLLKFFRYEGRFPRYKYEIPKEVLDYIAHQLHLSPRLFREYKWSGRTIEYHRKKIRLLLGFRTATAQDGELLSQWLLDHVLVHDIHPEYLKDRLIGRCRNGVVSGYV